MHAFEQSAIARQRQAFEDCGFEKVPLTYKGVTYQYYVIPAAWDGSPTDLPNFVMRMTPRTESIRGAADPSAVTLFGVSSDVPEKFRTFCIIHEIEEFVHIGINRQGRCHESTMKEIALVRADPDLTDEDKRAYLILRLNFFRTLIEYARAKGFPKEDITEFRESYLTLLTSQV